VLQQPIGAPWRRYQTTSLQKIRGLRSDAALPFLPYLPQPAVSATSAFFYTILKQLLPGVNPDSF
jgi:hypothetical protein